MDSQHPNRRGERGLRALTSSPAAPARGFDRDSQYDRFLSRARSRDPGRSRCREPVAAAGANNATAAAQMATEPSKQRTRRPERLAARGDASEQVVNRHLVVAALGRLTQEHRDVLRECCFRGSSVAQAAHALEIAHGTVKSRTYYALRALQLAIEELRDAE